MAFGPIPLGTKFQNAVWEVTVEYYSDSFVGTLVTYYATSKTAIAPFKETVPLSVFMREVVTNSAYVVTDQKPKAKTPRFAVKSAI